MTPPLSLLRTGLALAAGLLLAATASPAAAEHPEPLPSPFQAEDLGEDGCTVFETTGQAGWAATHPGEDHRVEVSGEALVLQTPGDPEYCLPVVPADRRIEFTAYADGAAIAEHVEPIDAASSPTEYQFAFTGPVRVDHITVAVCQEPRGDGSTWEGRCGTEVTVEPGGQVEEPGEPQSYVHEFELPDGCHRATVDATLQWLDPTRVRIEGTAVTEQIDPDVPCDPIDPQLQHRVLFTANHNDSVVEEAEVPVKLNNGVEEFGFVLPSDPAAVVDVHYVVAKICAFDLEGANTGCLPDSVQGFEPEPEEERYCEFTFAVTSEWANGYVGEVAITPLVEPMYEWRVVLTFPGGQVLQTVWNADWTQSGGTAVLSNTSWNGAIPVGGTVTVGFVVSGPSTPAPIIEVYGNGRACDPAP